MTGNQREEQTCFPRPSGRQNDEANQPEEPNRRVQEHALPWARKKPRDSDRVQRIDEAANVITRIEWVAEASEIEQGQSCSRQQHDQSEWQATTQTNERRAAAGSHEIDEQNRNDDGSCDFGPDCKSERDAAQQRPR